MVNPFKWVANKARAALQQPVQTAHTWGWLNPGGIPVTLYTAMRWATFWALSSRIGKIMATLPVKVMRLEGQRRILDEKQTADISWLWDYSPNDVWNGPKFKEALTTCAVIQGNSYAEIRRDGFRKPKELNLLHTGSMTPEYLNSGIGPFVYGYTDALGRKFNYDPKDIVHIAGPGRSLCGDSLIEIGGQTIAEGKAISDYALAWYQSAGNLGGYVSAKNTMLPEKREEYEKKFVSSWGGGANAGGVILLDGGMTFTPLGAKIGEANVALLREDILLEIARLMDIPIPLIQYKAGAQGYGSNIETLIDGFLKFSFGRWCAVVGAELTVKLFPRHQGPTYVVEVDTSALKRGTLLSQSSAYANLVKAGIATPNECRVLAGWNTSDEEGMDNFRISSGQTPVMPEEPTPDEPSKEEQDNQPEEEKWRF